MLDGLCTFSCEEGDVDGVVRGPQQEHLTATGLADARGGARAVTNATTAFTIDASATVAIAIIVATAAVCGGGCGCGRHRSIIAGVEDSLHRGHQLVQQRGCGGGWGGWG